MCAVGFVLCKNGVKIACYAFVFWHKQSWQYSIQNVKSISMVFCSHALILHLMQLEWTGALIRLPDLGYDCKFSKRNKNNGMQRTSLWLLEFHTSKVWKILLPWFSTGPQLITCPHLELQSGCCRIASSDFDWCLCFLWIDFTETELMLTWQELSSVKLSAHHVTCNRFRFSERQWVQCLLFYISSSASLLHYNMLGNISFFL
jgi:hypothetical protein